MEHNMMEVKSLSKY